MRLLVIVIWFKVVVLLFSFALLLLCLLPPASLTNLPFDEVWISLTLQLISKSSRHKKCMELIYN